MTSEKNRKVAKDGHILTNGESFGYVVVLNREGAFRTCSRGSGG